MIKVLKNTFFALSLMLFAMPAQADMSDLNGPFLAVSVGVGGAIVDGKYTDNEAVATSATGGGVAQIGGYEGGYTYATDRFMISVGAAAHPGEIDLADIDSESANEDITIRADGFQTVFATLGFAISDSTVFFGQAGQTDVDLKYTGTNVTGTKPSGISGDNYAVGFISSLANGMFVKSEVGGHQFDKITLNDINSSSGSAGGDVEATPEVIYGLISLGYTF